VNKRKNHIKTKYHENAKWQYANNIIIQQDV